MKINPYSAPTADDRSDTPGLSAIDGRQDDLTSCRRNCRMIGLLILVMGIVFDVAAVVTLSSALIESGFENRMFLIGTATLFLLIGVPLTTVGIGVRRFRPWARTPAIGLCAFALLAVPIGTILGAVFISILLSDKAKRVFAGE